MNQNKSNIYKHCFMSQTHIRLNYWNISLVLFSKSLVLNYIFISACDFFIEINCYIDKFIL